MARKKDTAEHVSTLLDPIEIQINLLTCISKDDMVATVNLVSQINKDYPKPGSLAIKATLLPNQYSIVNLCSLYAAEQLAGLTDKDEIVFYQRYYYALANDNRTIAIKALQAVIDLPAKSFSETVYLDAIKLALKFNSMNNVAKIKEKI